MAEYSELQNKFHLISGTYIAGQIFAEYTTFLKDAYNHKTKGDTTKINRIIEAEAKVIRLIDILGNELKSIGCDLGITHVEIDKLQQTLYAHLQLNETNIKRVSNLIAKLKKEEDGKG